MGIDPPPDFALAKPRTVKLADDRTDEWVARFRLVGDDPGSRWYVNGKHKDCAEVGIESIRVDLPEVAGLPQGESALLTGPQMW